MTKPKTKIKTKAKVTKNSNIKDYTNLVFDGEMYLATYVDGKLVNKDFFDQETVKSVLEVVLRALEDGLALLSAKTQAK